MDEFVDRTPVVRFAPDRRITALAASGAVVLLLLAAFAADAPSRLLFAVGVVVLMCFVLGDLVFSPRVTASPRGVVLRSPLVRAELDWADIDVVRVDTRARLGVRSNTLEVDAGETLAVFSRRSLGVDPEDAARVINACRPIGGERPGQE